MCWAITCKLLVCVGPEVAAGEAGLFARALQEERAHTPPHLIHFVLVDKNHIHHIEQKGSTSIKQYTVSTSNCCYITNSSIVPQNFKLLPMQ